MVLVVKNPPASRGYTQDLGSIPGSGRSPGEWNGNPLHYSCLENSMEEGAWWATVQETGKIRTWLSPTCHIILYINAILPSTVFVNMNTIYSNLWDVGLKGCIGLPWWLSAKESTCNAGDPGSFPGLGRSPGKGHGNLFQYSCLVNPMDREAWRATVRGSHRVRYDWSS